MFDTVDYQSAPGFFIWNLDFLILVLLAISAMTVITFWNRRAREQSSVLVWGWIGVLITLMLGGIWINRIDLSARKHWNTTYKYMALNFATSFETMGHDKIVPDGSSEQDPLFQKLFKVCKFWQTENPLISCICTFRKINDDTYVYVLGPAVDYDHNGIIKGEIEEYAPPGTDYKYDGKIDPELAEAISTGEPAGALFPYVHAGAQFTSATIPMKNPDGAVNSAVMVDFHGDIWIRNVQAARKPPLYAIGVFLFVGMVSIVSILNGRCKEEERLGAILDAAPFPCKFWNNKYQIIECNTAAVQLFGLTRKDELINRFNDFSPVNQPDGTSSSVSAKEKIAAAFLNGFEQFEWLHLNLNHEPIPSEITLVRVALGYRTIVVGYVRDLREYKRFTENLENARMESERANSAKSEFLAHMSHEIRTPLNGVIGLSDLLIGTQLSPKQYEYAQLINDSGKSLLFLINDILDFSKIEADKLEIDSEPFDLPTSVESVIGILSSRASGKNLELGVVFGRNVPRIVEGDSGRIRQILLNLVGNAVKFTEHGGVRIAVELVSVGENDITICFEVIDTGIGIPKDRIHRLFRAFSQADKSSARTYGGTGLGLAISMKLVHLMGGEIGVKSIEGKGSTFWFTISFTGDHDMIECVKRQVEQTPYERCPNCPHVDGDICTAVAYRGFGESYNVKGRTVLIIDDNEVESETLRIQLSTWGMVCTTCDSGDEAMEILDRTARENAPFDLLIIDNMLREETGKSLSARIYERKNAGIAIPRMILLRSLSEEIDQEFLDKIGGEAIGKPVYVSSLFDAVMGRLFSDAGVRSIRPKACGSPAIISGVSILAEKIHILIVEDNRVNQIVVKNLVEASGFTCDIANNGNEACDAVRNKAYDIVLMDCQMPELDGFEATDLIRKWEHDQARKRVPIIALTANATKEDVQKCFDCGMDAYCSKPINPQIVIRLIEEWYEKSSSQ